MPLSSSCKTGFIGLVLFGFFFPSICYSSYPMLISYSVFYLAFVLKSQSIRTLVLQTYSVYSNKYSTAGKLSVFSKDALENFGITWKSCCVLVYKAHNFLNSQSQLFQYKCCLSVEANCSWLQFICTINVTALHLGESLNYYIVAGILLALKSHYYDIE